MTAYAIGVTASKAVIASDTLAYLVDAAGPRPLGFIRKIYPLPNIRAVLIGRGMVDILIGAYTALLSNPAIVDVEAAAEALPPMLDALSKRYALTHGLGDYAGFALLEAALIGWSARERRPRIWGFNSYERYAAQADRPGFAGILSFPRLPPEREPDLAGLGEDAALIETIKAIGRMFAELPVMRGALVGGQINTITITEAGLTTRTIHTFPDYEATRVAGAAVAARVQRGDLKPDIAGGLVRIADCVDPLVATSAHVTKNSQRPSPAERRRAERMAARKERAA